jgi:hypothetical protein
VDWFTSLQNMMSGPAMLILKELLTQLKVMTLEIIPQLLRWWQLIPERFTIMIHQNYMRSLSDISLLRFVMIL